MRVHYAHAPAAFPDLVGELPDGVKVLRRPAGDLDLVMLFATAAVKLHRDDFHGEWNYTIKPSNIYGTNS